MFFSDSDQPLRDDLALRRSRLIAAMEAAGADAALICTNMNLFYLTGKVPDGYFYLNTKGETRLFIRRPVTWAGEGILPIKHPSQIPGLLSEEGIASPAALLLEEDLVPHGEFVQLQSYFPQAAIVTNMLRRVRMIKTPYEQQIVRQACIWHAQCMEKVPALYKPGMTDWDFCVDIEHMFRQNGHLGFFNTYGRRMDMFMGSVLSGKNGAAPSPRDFSMGGMGAHPILPVGVGRFPMSEGETVMVDISGNVNGYLSDITRTYAIGRMPCQLAVDAHGVSMEIVHAIQKAAQPGVPVCDMWTLATGIVAAHGLEKHFMGLDQQSRFVGHGLGLEINEPPVMTAKDVTPLQPGMTMAVEPKFVIPDVGAVGMENTFLITDNGAENLTICEESMTVLG